MPRFEGFERGCRRLGSAGSSLDSRESLTIVTFAFLFFLRDLRGFRLTLGASIEDSSSANDVFCLEDYLATEACFDRDLECFDCFDFLDDFWSSLIEAREILLFLGGIVDCEGTYPSLVIIL